MSKRTNNSIEKDSRTQPDPFDSERFIGTNSLIDKQAEQLEEFEVWFQNRDWLAFHHHHYDWWMFPSRSLIIGERTNRSLHVFF